MFTFIDLFAGIGGTRLAFEKAGGECVFTSEWDKFCHYTYYANFGEKPAGDITKIDAADIPDHDVLLAGFPCQPFSIAGVSKKISLGREHGFDDKLQGNLFFDIARILKEKRPKVFMLENVKNLKSHDKGKTYKVISDTLKLLNYKIFVKIVDAKHYVPQHRERIFIVGFDKKKFRNIKFKFPKMPEARRYELDEILLSDVDNKYTLTERLWLYLKNYAKKHRERGNGFGYGLIDSTKDKYTRTLSARYYKDGSEILIKQDKRRPRRLTPRECARLMGFDDSFKIVVSDTQAYRQFGNSLVVPVVEDIASKIVNHLNTGKKYGQNYNKAQKLEHVAYQV